MKALSQNAASRPHTWARSWRARYSTSAEAGAGVLRAQIRLTQSLLPLGLLTNVVMALILPLVLANRAARPAELLWVACCALLSGLRYAGCRLRRPTPDPEGLARIRRGLCLGAVGQGILWGLAGTALLPGDPLSQVLLLAVIGGICAGGVIILCPIWPAHLLLVVPATVPLCFRLLAADLPALRLAGGLGLFCVAALLLLGSRLSRWLEAVLDDVQEIEAKATLQEAVNLVLLRGREQLDDSVAEQCTQRRGADGRTGPESAAGPSGAREGNSRG